MAASSGPRWDAPAPGQNFRTTTTAWDLRWWIVAAVGTSIAVHAGLLLWMRNYRLPESPRAAAEIRTGVFETDLEPVSIPDRVLQPVEDTPPDITQKTDLPPPVRDIPSVTAIAGHLLDKDVLMTPMEAVAKNVTLSTPAPGRAGDLVDEVSPEKSAVDIDAGAGLLSGPATLTPSAMKPDDDQVLVDARALESASAALKGEVVKTVTKGEGGNNGLDGFQNLDDLANLKTPFTGDFKAMLRTDLLFDFGSAELRSGAKLSLMNLGAIIQMNARAQFRLVGHTDTIGDEISNQRLSEARAQAVKDWLVESLRISGANIVVEGRGEKETLPGISPDAGAERQQLNRRVEIHKTGGQ